MARPRMNKVLPRYASEFPDRHGKTRVRLRRKGWVSIYVHAEPGTPEFTEAYRNWEREGRIEVAVDRAKPGSFDDLISRFYKSKHWKQIKPSTQIGYRGELERFRKIYGKRTVATMTARHVGNLINKMADRPSAANNLRKRLGQLFKFAVQLGWRTDNPASVVSGLRIRSEGYRTWQEEQIAQFEAKFAVGTMPRLAFDLALYTAQRRSDVRTMGPQHVKNGEITVKQLKTGRSITIPLHPNLAESIARTTTGHLAFLLSSRGIPFQSTQSFGNWFGDRCREAGLEGYAMHGLRKAASRRMAETGLTNQEIKSITGHVTDSEVARYTREAEQITIARRAMAKMAKANHSKPDLSNPSQGIENNG